jgi:hypothetical protein
VRTYGTLIAWNNADQLSALGILHVILALVLVSGKVISDSASPIILPFHHLPNPDLTRLHSGPTHAPPSFAPPPSNTARTPCSLSAPLSNPRRLSSPTPAPRLPPSHAHRRLRQWRGKWRLTEARPWSAWRGNTAGKWRRRGQRRSVGVAVGSTCNGGDW